MRNVFIALLLALAASTALADPPDEDVHRPFIANEGGPYLQFDLGFNLTFLNGNTDARLPLAHEGATTFFQSGSGLGPLIGATIGYHFSPRFALSFRADYDSRHVAKSGTLRDTCTVTDEFNNVIFNGPIDWSKSFAVTADYLSLSLLANLRFDRLYIFAGPNIGIPLGFEVSETDQIVDANSACYFFSGTADTVKVVSGTTSGTDFSTQRFSLKIGAGYLIPLTSKLSLVPQLAYDLQLSNTLDQNVQNNLSGDAGPSTLSTGINGAMRLSALQATIGLRVNL